MINYGVRAAGAVFGGLIGASFGLRNALWISAAGALMGQTACPTKKRRKLTCRSTASLTMTYPPRHDPGPTTSSGHAPLGRRLSGYARSHER
jgi:hypothetical protein